MARYTEAKDGEWFRPRKRGFRHQCCACGLIHIVDFRVTDGGLLEMRFTRSERATAATRRARKKAVVIVDE